MDYLEMAAELVSLRAEQFKTPVWRRIAQLTHGELLALFYIDRHGGTYPKELSAQLHVTTARVAAMLRDMGAKGWIRRTEDARDSRQVFITLTDAGRQELRRCRDDTLSGLAAVLCRLGPEDAAEVIRLQKRMNEVCIKDI